jgi:hypothetical protein
MKHYSEFMEDKKYREKYQPRPSDVLVQDELGLPE